MRPLGRRLLFALLPAAPLAVVAVVKAPAAPIIDGRPLEALDELAASLQEWKPLPELMPIEPRFELRRFNALINQAEEVCARSHPTRANLAATLGIPYDGPRDWTDDEVALTLGIDVQRDGIAVSAMAVRA